MSRWKYVGVAAKAQRNDVFKPAPEVLSTKVLTLGRVEKGRISKLTERNLSRRHKFYQSQLEAMTSNSMKQKASARPLSFLYQIPMSLSHWLRPSCDTRYSNVDQNQTSVLKRKYRLVKPATWLPDNSLAHWMITALDGGLAWARRPHKGTHGGNHQVTELQSYCS